MFLGSILILATSLLIVSATLSSVSYHELDYTFTHKGNTTTMTGVRSVNDSTSLVYMSGFTWINLEYTDGKKTNYGAFIYRGDITGDGEWFGNFNFPSSPGANVSGTFFYGPCSGSASGIQNIPDENNFFQAVGDYSTYEDGLVQYGMLFQGYVNGSGTWTTLDPTSLLNKIPHNKVLGTIGHSTMGGLAVGNFNALMAPDQFRAFVYDIAADRYDELIYQNAAGQQEQSLSITAYCIWHNQGTEMYSIAGGLGSGDMIDGFIVNWNASSRNASDWRFFHHPNSTITHFQGMWPDFANQGVGYSFSANWVNAVNGSRGTSFVYVSNITSPDRTPSNVNWYDYHFPGTLNNSANSVYLNNTVAFFELENQIYAHGFVAQFTFDEAPPVPAPVPVPAPSGSDGDGGSSDPALSQGGVVAVSVVGGVVGLAVLAYAVYFVTSGTAASASAGASAGAAGGVASTVNPIATAGSANSGITMSDGTAGI